VESRQGAYRRYAEVYDRVWKAAPHHRFVDLYLEAASLAGVTVRRVVDAACGTGTAAIELARRGYRVAAFDLSEAMVARARAKCRQARRDGPGRYPLLLVGDLRAVPLADGCTDLVTVLNASVNYLLDPDELVAAFAHLRRLLGERGAVVFEPLSARFLYEGYEPNRHLADGDFRLDASYELQGDLLTERIRWRLDGVEATECYRQRYYDDARLRRLLAAAGLTVVDRLPMYPAIPAEPARGRTLWIVVP
jgi:SAM-dependent methyltransferase